MAYTPSLACSASMSHTNLSITLNRLALLTLLVRRDSSVSLGLWVIIPSPHRLCPPPVSTTLRPLASSYLFLLLFTTMSYSLTFLYFPRSDTSVQSLRRLDPSSRRVHLTSTRLILLSPPRIFGRTLSNGGRKQRSCIGWSTSRGGFHHQWRAAPPLGIGPAWFAV